MADVATLVDNYIATWNERDSGRRRALIAETFAENADYRDPLMSGEGQEGIDAMIAGVQQQYGEYRFELADGPDAHNDRCASPGSSSTTAMKSPSRPVTTSGHSRTTDGSSR